MVEDDHCAGISGAPLHTLAGSTDRWVFVRSASKAYGPDLRVAVLAGDRRTVERVHGRLRLGPGWVSHLLQDLAVRLWSDASATRLVHDAEARYRTRRTGLCDALAARGVDAHGRSGLNVWVPVPDETVAITRLIAAGGRRARDALPDRNAARNPRHGSRPERRRDQPARRRDRRGGARYRASERVRMPAARATSP